MNELEQILGIQLPKNIKISSVVNTTDKVIKDSIFFGLQGTRVHGSSCLLYTSDAADDC